MTLLKKVFDREFIEKNLAVLNQRGKEQVYQLIHPDMPDPQFLKMWKHLLNIPQEKTCLRPNADASLSP